MPDKPQSEAKARRKGKRANPARATKKPLRPVKTGRGEVRGGKRKKTLRRGDGETGRRGEKVKTLPPSEPLPDGQQEMFCRKMAMGVFSNYSCYLQAYPGGSVEAARSSSSVLLTKPNIKARIEWIRAESLKDVGESIEKAVRWYQAVIDTPVGYVDDESPLAQEVKREEVQMGGPQGKLKRGSADEGNESESPEMTLIKTTIKIPCKIKARERIDKLMGFEKPQELNVSLGYEPPGKAMERLTGKGVDLAAILKKAGIVK